MQSTVMEDSRRTKSILSEHQKNGSAGPQKKNSSADTITDAIAEKIGRHKFNVWFRNSANISLEGENLNINVPNYFIAKWIETHFTSQINQALLSVTGTTKKINFVIDPQLESVKKSAQSFLQSNCGEKTNAALTQTKTNPEQLRMLKLNFESFVVGPSNQLAFNAAKLVADSSQSPFNPLFIHGGYGVGKTHLMQSICNKVNKSRPQARWLYMSAEDFANQFVLALKTRKLEAFRSRIRQTELLAIDDIHFLASKPATQEEFLHTFNTIDLAGKQVVLASDAHPKMINQLSDKLVNRFVSGMVVKIEPPDVETRREICRQYFKKSSNSVSENVVNFVAENLKTSIREIEGALLKLTAFAAFQNHKITLELAQNVLADTFEKCEPVIKISDIESAVADFFAITPAAMRSAKKTHIISVARHFAMYLARKHTRLSSSEIGRCMGNKNHATVLLACQTIEKHLDGNSDISWQSPSGNRIQKPQTILEQLEEAITD